MNRVNVMFRKMSGCGSYIEYNFKNMQKWTDSNVMCDSPFKTFINI